MKKITLFLSLFFMASISNAVFEDGQVTNGGDPYAADFFIVLDGALAKMPLTLPLASGGTLGRLDLETIRLSVKVTSQDTVTLEGREVGAINRPFTSPPSIVLSRNIWKNLNLNQKLRLVLHETLPIAGIYDVDYKNSSLIVQLIEKTTQFSFDSLSSSVESCDEQFIESLSGDAFQTLITSPQQISIIFQALDAKCVPMIKKLHDWQVPMDLCMGSISLMNWFLRTDLRNTPKTIEIIQILKDSGVPSVKTCGQKVNDSCQFADKLPDKGILLPALQCK